jgi:HKD family nuclease
MLHSKVYIFELGGGASAAFVGSHNLTRFALYGLNGEASVLLEGKEPDNVRQVAARVLAARSIQVRPSTTWP